MSEILVPVSFGELLDKIAILEIKSERMSDAVKLANVQPGDKAYVAVAAVDLGILNLTKFQVPDPDGWFFGQRQLGRRQQQAAQGARPAEDQRGGHRDRRSLDRAVP